jgi:serine/threonine protein kinase
MVAHPERGTLVASRYRLESVIGEGGMAVVWRATHTETDRVVAVKLVRRELVEDEHVREMFVREARIAARIGPNRHIVDVLDAGLDPALEVPFIVMDLLTGDALDARIKSAGPLTPTLVADLVEQLGDALDQAHAAGVFHRDLKPQNLFIATDKRGRVELKVLDFGIAKLAESVQQSSTHVGTPAYSAPEQLGPSWRTIAEQRGKTIAAHVSAGTDVWAMGLVVYEMLVGATSGALWGAITLAELPLKIVLEPPPKPTERAGVRAHLLPTGFDAWASRCLDLDATKRFESAGAAAHAIAPSLRAMSSLSATLPLIAAVPSAARSGPPPPMVADASQRASSPAMPPVTPAPQHSSQPPPAAWGSVPPPPPPPGTDPRLVMWMHHRRAELRAPVDPRPYIAWNPFQFIARITHAFRDAHLPVHDARLALVEIATDDGLRRATGEDRFVLGLLTSPRILYRAALRTKQVTGFADGVARGLKILDGIVATSNAPSLGDPRLEAYFDLAFPSFAEGNAALPFSLRHLLMSVQFHGTLELRAGAFALHLANAQRFEPNDLDQIVEAAGRIYTALFG